MSQETACPHCHHTYSNANPPKYLVNCSHTICLQCLKELILCPVDRIRIQLRRFTLQAFKTNQPLLDFVTKQSSPSKSSKSHHNSKKSTPEQNESTSRQKSKSSRKIVQQVKIQRKISVTDFEVRKEELHNQQNTNTMQPQVSQVLEKITQPQVLSPKKQALNYQMCLLHSKKADLICVQDKAAICAGCGLFGQHKLHTLIPYDTFLNQYSTLAENCFKNYEQLQNRFQKMNTDLIQQQIGQLLTQKRGKQMKNIKVFIKQLNDLVKNVQKQLISSLDLTISFKKQKLMKSMCFQELVIKRDQYMSQVEGMTQGLQCLFNLQQFQKYIPFIDPNSQKSYIQQQGEYLIRQIDNYCKMIHKKIQEESSEFTFSFKNVDIDVFKSYYNIESYDSRIVNQFIQEQKKHQREKSANQYSSKPYTPSRNKNCKDTTVILNSAQKNKPSPIKNQAQDNLLLELNSKSNSPERKDKNISPIHPMCTFENFEIPSQCSMGPQFFLKVAQPPLPDPRNSKSKGRVNKTLHPPRASKSKLLQNSENYMGESTARLRSKPKSNNNSSNHMTERELLNVLNQKSDNKKRKKIELPQKYSKIYQELQKDRLQVIDFGGAFLGDQTVLAISENFIASRGKLKQIKLMNNKLSDDVFPDLISRCRCVHSLNLSYNQFTQRSLEWLLQEAFNLGDLKNITLSNNKIVLRSNRDKIEELKRRGINICCEIINISNFCKSDMKQKYCLESVDPFRTINQSQTNRSKTKQAYAFSKAPRFQTLQPNCLISTYSKELPKKNSGAIIGYGKKVDFTQNSALSPGTKYKLKGIFEQNKSKSKGYSLGLTRSKIAFDSYISPHVSRVPGVGRYHLQTETVIGKKRQPSFSMRKRTKMTDLTMTIQPQNHNPSPAHYQNNPQQSRSLFSSRFKRLSYSGSRSKRFFNPDNKVPGPGDYNNPTHMSNVGRYIMSTHRGGTWAKFDTSKRVTKLDQIARAGKQVPGPGSYRQSSEFGQYDGDVYRKLHSPSKRLLSQR